MNSPILSFGKRRTGTPLRAPILGLSGGVYASWLCSSERVFSRFGGWRDSSRYVLTSHHDTSHLSFKIANMFFYYRSSVLFKFSLVTCHRLKPLFTYYKLRFFYPTRPYIHIIEVVPRKNYFLSRPPACAEGRLRFGVIACTYLSVLLTRPDCFRDGFSVWTINAIDLWHKLLGIIHFLE